MNFIPERRTLNKEMYIEIPLSPQGSEKEMSEEMGMKQLFFLHYNASAHRSLVVKNFLAKHNVTALGHPSYSLDLSLSNLFLFLQLKSMLKGH
jgi:hypothetical protein